MANLKRDVSAYVGFLVLYLATAASLRRWEDTSQLVLALALAPALTWLSVCDLRRQELPDVGTVCVAGIALGFTAIVSPEKMIVHAVTAFLITAALWGGGALYFHRVGQEGLGIGDAKLFGAGALLLGPWALPELFLISSIGGIIGGLIARYRGGNIELGIPFGPFIAYAIFILSFLDPLFL